MSLAKKKNIVRLKTTVQTFINTMYAIFSALCSSPLWWELETNSHPTQVNDYQVSVNFAANNEVSVY